jgi:hypothetical protein
MKGTLSEGVFGRSPFLSLIKRLSEGRKRAALGLSGYPDLGYSDILGLGYSISQFGILSVELNRFAVEFS